MNTKTLLDVSSEEAKAILYHPRSYCTLDLPEYFDFSQMIKAGKELVQMPFRKSKKDSRVDGIKWEYDFGKIRKCDSVNHRIVSNKDGQYAWRTYELIHPVLYAELVETITAPKNWEEIQGRFKIFQQNENIRCVSIPFAMYSGRTAKRDTSNWVEHFEKESVRLSMEYRYLATTDITDCYGSLYTHTIAWALHDKDVAKCCRKRDDLFGNEIDNIFQDMHEGQTNGIPQGSVISNLIAEIVLGYVDMLVGERLENFDDYMILRYRDDYRIFVNEAKRAQHILVVLSEELEKLNFRLNDKKTTVSSDVIKSSLKPDKWGRIVNPRRYSLDYESLMAIREFSLSFPNGSALKYIIGKLNKKHVNPDISCTTRLTLAAIVADIMQTSPELYRALAETLRRILLGAKDECKENILKKVIERLRTNDVPNLGLFEIWMQQIDDNHRGQDYHDPLCKLVMGENITLWSVDWLEAFDEDATRLIDVIKSSRVLADNLEELQGSRHPIPPQIEDY